MFKFNRQDYVKLGKSLLIAVSGAALPVLTDFFEVTDFGMAGSIITATGTVAVNALRRWVMDYTR